MAVHPVPLNMGAEAMKLLYMVLAQENEKLLTRRLRGFAELSLGSCRAAGHTQ